MIYPGAGPEEVETLIVEPIEEEIATIGGIKSIQAVAREGVAIIIAEFEVGTAVDIVAIDVKDKIDALRVQLPEDAEDPVVSKFDINAQPIIDLAVSGPLPLEQIYRLAKDVVKDRLATVTGVASVEIVGGKEREILVAVERERLEAYDLSILDILAAIGAANLEIPGGHIKQGQREYTVRLAGEFPDVEAIRRVHLMRPGRSPVKLSEVAKIVDTFEEQRTLARFGDQPAVGLSIIKQGDANTVQVANGVRRELEKLSAGLPEGVEVAVATDRSQFIRASIQDVMSNLLIGIVLTALVLFLFLHSARVTVIAAVAMPTSIVATFMLIRFAGYSINFMSLMGLAISVGILVANSIVVLENIIRRVQKGEAPAEAADLGTAEIALAVVASTLTNIVVFTPIAFMGGIVGQFFQQFGMTVAFATLFSLLVSFTLTPMLAAFLLRRDGNASAGGKGAGTGLQNRFAARWDQAYERLEQSYRGGLSWALAHRKTVFGVIGLAFFGSLALAPFIGSEFFTPSDEGRLSVIVEMPAGARLEETDRALARIEAILRETPEVQAVYTILGKLGSGGLVVISEGVDVGEITVQLVDQSERDRTTIEVLAGLLPELSAVPAAEISVKASNPFGGGSEADLQIEVTGDEMGRLERLAYQVKDIVKATPGTNSVRSSWKVGKPEIRIHPDAERLAAHGLVVGQLASVIRTSIEGEVASEYREADDEYDIRVRFADADRATVDQVADIVVSAGPGYTLPISEVATIDYGEGPTQVARKNKQRLIVVSANVTGRTIGEVQREVEAALEDVQIPAGFEVFFGGQSERQAESFGQILRAMLLAIILTYMALAAILESYVHPLTIMLTLPLGLVGVILSLVVTDSSLSIFSMMALVMLVGIVVNNGILLLDYVEVLRRRGTGLREAVVTACSARLRPILMMNLAVTLGMLPLALGLGQGAETRAPMAIVSIGGIVSSTIFTLFLIPTLYDFVERFRRRYKSETEA
jgi:HAE1 family hydrophobic/amphiphilic exporter-1